MEPSANLAMLRSPLEAALSSLPAVQDLGRFVLLVLFVPALWAYGEPPAVPEERSLHHAELEVTRRVMPIYPGDALCIELEDQRCEMHVGMDEDGVPDNVTVAGCHWLFHDSAREAIMAWRWRPLLVGGRPVRAWARIGISYRTKNRIQMPGVAQDDARPENITDGSDLRVRTMAIPKYPDAARDLQLQPQRCEARVRMNGAGLPLQIQVEGCHEALHDSARESLLAWRWYPYPPAPTGRMPSCMNTIVSVYYPPFNDALRLLPVVDEGPHPALGVSYKIQMVVPETVD